MYSSVHYCQQDHNRLWLALPRTTTRCGSPSTGAAGTFQECAHAAWSTCRPREAREEKVPRKNAELAKSTRLYKRATGTGLRKDLGAGDNRHRRLILAAKQFAARRVDRPVRRRARNACLRLAVRESSLASSSVLQTIPLSEPRSRSRFCREDPISPRLHTTGSRNF